MGPTPSSFGIGAIIHTSRYIQCLPYAGFSDKSFSSVLSVCDSKSHRLHPACSQRKTEATQVQQDFVTNGTKVDKYFVTVHRKGHCCNEEWLYKEQV